MITKTFKHWPKRRVETFFDEWNPKMTYILGYFAADGTMYRNPHGGCYITFTSTEKELIQLIKQIMLVENNIEVYQPKKGKTKLRYTLQIGSKILYSKLIKLGFTPNKSLTLKYPSKLPNEFVNHFLRGYFDGDGCAYFGFIKRKDRNGYAKHLQINLRCGSRIFLESLQKKAK